VSVNHNVAVCQDLSALTNDERFNYYTEHLITCFSVLLIAVFIRAVSAEDLSALTNDERFNYYTEHLITCFSVLLIAVFIRAVSAAILIVF